MSVLLIDEGGRVWFNVVVAMTILMMLISITSHEKSNFDARLARASACLLCASKDLN